jgi:hypothetical protein
MASFPGNGSGSDDEDANNKRLKLLQSRFDELKSTGTPPATIGELENRLKVLKGDIDKDGNQVAGSTADELFQRFEKLTGNKAVASGGSKPSAPKATDEAAVEHATNEFLRSSEGPLAPMHGGDIMGFLKESSYEIGIAHDAAVDDLDVEDEIEMLLAEAAGLDGETGGVGEPGVTEGLPENAMNGASLKRPGGLHGSKALDEAEELIYSIKNQNLLNAMGEGSVGGTGTTGHSEASDAYEDMYGDGDDLSDEPDEVRALIVQAQERARLDEKYSKFDEDGKKKDAGAGNEKGTVAAAPKRAKKKRYAGISSGSSSSSSDGSGSDDSSGDGDDY